MVGMDTDGNRTCEQSGDEFPPVAPLSRYTRGESDGERAVTPVIANILLVAVVLVVAMVVAVLAFGLLDGVNDDLPVASFDVDRGSDGAVSLVHLGGDSLDTERLSVAFGDRTYPVDSYVSAEKISSGTVIGPVYPSAADEVSLVWKDRATSELLYSVPASGEGSVPHYLRFDDKQIGSYGESQDDDGDYRTTNGGRTLHLQNNGWKYVPYETEVTSESVLAFDFKSTDEGEIHGIGFEDDTSPSSDRIFKLFGTQSGWADQYERYNTTDGWVHYEIPVGNLYSGSQRQNLQYVAFVNDLDDASETSDSWFRNVRVQDSGATRLSVAIDGTTEHLPIKGYGSQDSDGTHQLQDDGETLRLTNNTWKYVPVNLTVTDQTTVSFEFNSTSEGEIHAVGFETDDSQTESQFVRLDGTQHWGVEYGTYDTGDGWVRYEITIDDQTNLAGTDISRLVFVNDDDGDASGVSLFRNVTVSKTG